MRSIEEILVDYFDGAELSSAEMFVLKKWSECSSNAELLSILENMRTGKFLREKLRGNPQQGMLFIRQKINQRRFHRWGVYSSVASLTLLLVTGLVYWLYSIGNFREEPIEKRTLTGNEAFPRLTLASGKVIPLLAESGGVIVVDSSFRIVNADHMLIYNENTVGRETEYNTVSIPVGAEYNVRLPDGTTVYLNAGSELRFPVVFSENTREVYLDGEAYFEVAKDSVKPFKVHTTDMIAVVFGTSFNVRSYADQNYVATTLEEGHLKVICQQQEYDLTPGHQVYHNRQTRISGLIGVNTKYYTSWKDGYYWFNETSLEEIMEILAKWYGLNVFYLDDEVKKLEFSGRLKRYESFDYLLDKFKETGVAEFEINKNVVRVKKK